MTIAPAALLSACSAPVRRLIPAFIMLMLPTVAVLAQVTEPLRPVLSGDISRDWLIDGTGVWNLADNQLVLAKAGTPGGPIRRPAALAILRQPIFGRVAITAGIRSTVDPSIIRADVLVVFGYQSPTQFYYVHLSGVTDAVHNGIFIVDGADRRRIDDGKAAPQLSDREWHRVRLERDLASGRIEVYMDDATIPGLVATDTTFATGLVGFGSFDDTALIRDIAITRP